MLLISFATCAERPETRVVTVEVPTGNPTSGQVRPLKVCTAPNDEHHIRWDPTTEVAYVKLRHITELY